MSDIGRGNGDKRVDWAADEVQLDNACYCLHLTDLPTAKHVGAVGALICRRCAIKARLFKNKPVFEILVSLTGSRPL